MSLDFLANSGYTQTDKPTPKVEPHDWDVILQVHKGDYELTLTRQGYREANKPRFNRMLKSLFPKQTKSKKGKKNGKV